MAITPSSSASALQGNPVSPTAPTNGQALVWNGTLWVPAAPSGSPGSYATLAGAGTITLSSSQQRAYIDNSAAQTVNLVAAPANAVVDEPRIVRFLGSPATGNVTIWGDATHTMTIEDPKAPGTFTTSITFTTAQFANQVFGWRVNPVNNTQWVIAQ